MTDDANYRDLLAFLYQCPVGLVEFDDDGTVLHINPAAVSLAVAAWGVTDFDNLYSTLSEPWPDLADITRGRAANGLIDENVILAGTDPGGTRLGATIVRIAEHRIMLVLADATARVSLEQQRAELLQAEQRAHHRFETLERNASHLAAAVSSDDVADSVTTELRGDLSLDYVSVLCAGEHGVTLLGTRERHDASGELPADVQRQIRLAAAEAIVIDDTLQVTSSHPTLCATDPDDPASISTLAALPLRGADKHPIGALVVASTVEHTFDGDAITLLNGIARQTGLALERARLFEAAVAATEQERAIALRLQRALLPDGTIDVDGITIATRVKAASDLMKVGGDWYDSFVWPTGEIAVIVGDVVGHDVESAVKMGRLRWGLSAQAAEIGPDPERLLAALDRIAHDSARVDFATAVCVVIDPETSRATYASAGHPPPIVVARDGETRLLDQATSPPVGVDLSIDHQASACDFEQGSSLVVYTDGLVERRGRSIDAGIDDLRSLITSNARVGPDDLAQLIADRHESASGSDDDMIVLVVRWDETDSD